MKLYKKLKNTIPLKRLITTTSVHQEEKAGKNIEGIQILTQG